MLVFFSGRRLKPGTYEQFREAWSPEDDEDMPPGMVTIYHARHVKDENEVISFGIFDIDRDQLEEIRDEAAELKRQDAMAQYVEDVPIEGVYEVVEEIKP